MSTREARHQARHLGRILAMQVLYEADIARHDARHVLERLTGEEDHAPATLEFARRLIDGIVACQEEIDSVIARAAPVWPLAQMAKIDKSILRIAAFEILKQGDVPFKAAINEAVEIAKVYGSDSSSRFVNGVLGTIATQHLGDRRASMPEETRPDQAGEI